MRAVGAHWFDDGYDVVAFQLTTAVENGVKMNAALLPQGIQLYGFWSRVVCDGMASLRLRETYTKVHLYGFSNGGLIADHVSVLCTPVTTVIVDDIVSDWLQIAADRPLYNSSSYFLYYLGPLLSQGRPADWVMSSRSPKWYSRHSIDAEPVLDTYRESLQVHSGVDKSTFVGLLLRRERIHVVVTDYLDALLQGEPPDLPGFTLLRRDGLTSG